MHGKLGRQRPQDYGYCSWFKCIGDSKMPTTKDKLITRYEQTKNHIENGRTYLKPGEEAVVDVVDGERNEVGDSIEDE